jgi:hypothetical protein
MAVLQSLAGHTDAQTTPGYIGPFTEHKRAALERWAKQLFPFVPSLRPFDGIAEVGGSVIYWKMVGAPGFEPGTSCAQGKRATRLRHAPRRAGARC